jgi:heme-degrading monooxygenase HmoA
LSLGPLTGFSPYQSITKENLPVVQLTEMDRNVALIQQLEDAGGPVLLVNKFDVAADEVDHFMSAWADDARYLKRQPGYISAQLHRGIAGSCVFLNVALWESVAHFRNAFADPEFQQKLDHYPHSAVASPHLFRKVAVSDVCIA